MGHREMILTLAAVFFFSMTSLSMNRIWLQNNDIMMKSEFDYYAISLAQRIIEETKTRAFDSNVESGPAANPPDDFVSPHSLGPRWDEVYPNFSDVDDYNNLYLTINTPRANYLVFAFVRYIDENNLDRIVEYRTFFKKLFVVVLSDYISTPVILSHVFAYYEF